MLNALRNPLVNTLAKPLGRAAVLSVCCVSPVWAGDGFEFEGLRELRFSGSTYDSTALVPSRDFLDQAEYRAVAGTVLRFSYRNGPVRLFSQFRTFVTYDDIEEFDAEITVDEAFAEFALGDSAFVHIGRKNLARGQAFSFSSIDLFTDELELDRSLNQDRQGREIEGTDSIGFDWFVGNTVTLSGVYAPEDGSLNKDRGDRAELSANVLFPDINADLTVLVHEDGDDLVYGLGYTQAIGDAFVLYGDATLRDGQNQFVPTLLDATTGAFGDARNTQDQFLSASLGLGYTRPDGQSWNFEYFYNEAGLTQAQWDNTLAIAQINAGLTGPQAQGNLLRLNAALRSPTLRQNYGFIRYATPALFGLSGISGEATLLHQLEDNSGVLGLRGELENDEGDVIGLHVSHNYGGKDTEFGLRNQRLTATLYFTKSF